MLGEALASRFEFTSQPTEDKLGRHMIGRRLADDAPVILTVLDPQLKVSTTDVIKVSETSRNLSDLMLSSVLHCIEVGRTEGGNLYLLSEAAGIDPLRSLIRARNGLPVGEALAIAYQLAATMREASAVGIDHLDMTSGNVFVTINGDHVSVKTARYGFHHLLPVYSPTRKGDAFYGMPEYMAPEICSGKPGNASTDLYSLGILMYEMVSGKPPFVSSSPSTTIKRQVYEKPLPLHLVKPGAPNLDAYEKVVARLLGKDARGRPADANEAMEAIASCAAGIAVKPLLETPEPRASTPEVHCLLEGVSIRVEERRPAAEPAVRGTMMFTGFSTLSGEPAGPTAEPAPAPEERPAEAAPAAAAPEPDVAPSERPTVHLPPEKVSPPDERPAYEQRPTEAISVDAVTRQIEAMAAVTEASPEPDRYTPVPVKASMPFSTAEPTVAPAPGEQPAAEVQATGKVIEMRPATGMPEEAAARKHDDWFEKGRHPSLPPEDKEEKKEHRTFWIILGAVVLIVLVMVAVWIDQTSGPKEEAATPPPAGDVRPEPPMPAPPQPAPPRPAAVQPDVPAPAPAPRPPEKTPEQLKAEQVKAAIAYARGQFESGNLEDARKALETVLRDEPANGDAKALLASVTQKIEASRKPPPPAPPEPKKPEKVVAPKEPPAKKPEKVEAPKPPPGPQLTDEERAEKVKGFIRAGRDAYNRGDYQGAIGAYNRALGLDPRNALVPKLLEQAKAKVNQ